MGDKVDVGKLLPGSDEDTGEGAEKVFVVGDTEAVSVRRLAQFLLVLEGNTNLIKFDLELGVVGRERNGAGESAGGLLVALLLDEPSRLWEEDHTDSENKGPNELDSNGELPGSVSGLVLGSIVDDGSEETEGDRPLITGDESTTVLIVWVSDQAMSAKTNYEAKRTESTLGSTQIGTWGLISKPSRHPNQRRYDKERKSGSSGLCGDTSYEDEDSEGDW